MTIPTTPPSGFRDFLPEQVLARQRALEAIARTYRAHGFQPVATSAVEDLQVLLGKGGGENEKLIFKIMKRGEALERAQAEGGELADLGLRFDLTLPLARWYSRHGSQLSHPFKAFHAGPVWRAERAQKGRYREFVQCDVDIIGAESWGAEVEVISAMLAAFGALGLEPTVLVNDRGLLLGTLRGAGVPEEELGRACVALDKLDKTSPESVKAELGARGDAVFAALEKLSAGTGPERERLDAILKSVNALAGRPAASYFPFLVRGFDYYTSTVFEFRLEGAAGSIGGGGRYDRLTEAFGTPKTPAVGGSIGFERAMPLVEEKLAQGATLDAVVTVFDDALRGRSLEVGAALRAKGLAVDVYPGSGKLKAQFKYADQKKAAYALVIGPDEAARGVVQVKSLSTGEEQAVSVDEACALIAARG